ncbi:MAG: D-Ala-D-Ala carboxypeptidase family metallohydrolase [Methylobacter sp.]
MNRAYPKNFSRAELLRSNTAMRLGIKNEPDSDELEQNILNTALFLQRLRDKLQAVEKEPLKIRVYSCYRSPELNRAVGGSKSSAHMKGLAADIVADDWTPMQLATFIRAHFEFDQLILEFPDKNGGGWVHVGIPTLTEPSRHAVLTAKKINGETVYLHGLTDC